MSPISRAAHLQRSTRRAASGGGGFALANQSARLARDRPRGNARRRYLGGRLPDGQLKLIEVNLFRQLRLSF